MGAGGSSTGGDAEMRGRLVAMGHGNGGLTDRAVGPCTSCGAEFKHLDSCSRMLPAQRR